MSNILLKATLKDRASPVLRLLSANIRGFNKALGTISASGKAADGSLRDVINKLHSQIGAITDAIGGLAILRVVVGTVAAAFAALSLVITTTIGVMQLAISLFANVQPIIRGLIWVTKGLWQGLGLLALGFRKLLIEMAPLVARITATTAALASNAFARATPLLKRLGGAFTFVSRGALLLSAKIVLIVAAFVALGIGIAAAIKNWDKIVAGFKKGFEVLGEIAASIVATIVPSFVKGFFGKILDVAKQFFGYLKKVAMPIWQGFMRLIGKAKATQAVQSITALGIAVKDVLVASTSEANRELQGLGGTLAHTAESVIPKLIEGWLNLKNAFSGVTDVMNLFKQIDIQSAFGQIKIPSAAILQLFHKVGNELNQGANMTLANLSQNIGSVTQKTVQSLLLVFNELPEKMRGGLSQIIQSISNTGLKSQLQKATNDLWNVIAKPDNLSALNAGDITDEVAKQIENYKALNEEFVKIKEDVAKRIGLIEQTSAQRQAKIRTQQNLQQTRAFVAAAGPLLSNHKKLAIALATVDAGLAITSAIKHSAGYGPVYMSLYVASVAASLASTISSLKSNSLPTSVAQSTVPVGASQQSQAQPAQINVFTGDGLYTGSQLKELIESVGDAQRGRSGQLAA